MKVLYMLGAATLALALGAPSAPCQSLGEAAAKERERRKNLKPAKVITEDELHGRGTVSTPGAAPADDASPKPEDAKSADDKTKDPAKKEKTDDEVRAEAAKNWKAKVDQCQAEITRIQAEVDRAQTALGDLSQNLYGGTRAAAVSRLESGQKALKDAQAKMDELQEEGRRNRY